MKRHPIAKSRWIAFATVGAAVTGIVGIAAIPALSGEREDVVPAQFAEATTRPIAPASSSRVALTPSELLEEIVRHVGSSEIIRAEIGGPPEWASAVERESPSDARVPPAGNFLYVTIANDKTPGGALRAIWIANLIGGVLADALDAHGLGQLASIQILKQLPDGTITEAGGGIGNVVRHQVFSVEPRSIMASRIRAGARENGFEVKSIEFVPAMQDAPNVVLDARQGHSAIEKASQPNFLSKIFGNPRNLEGFYLQIDDSSGPIMKAAGAHRSGVGLGWVDPRYSETAGKVRP